MKILYSKTEKKYYFLEEDATSENQIMNRDDSMETNSFPQNSKPPTFSKSTYFKARDLKKSS